MQCKAKENRSKGGVLVSNETRKVHVCVHGVGTGIIKDTAMRCVLWPERLLVTLNQSYSGKGEGAEARKTQFP